MNEQRLVISCDLGERGREILERAFAGSARITFHQDVPEAERASQLRAADVLLSWLPARELRAGEWGELGRVSLM